MHGKGSPSTSTLNLTLTAGLRKERGVETSGVVDPSVPLRRRRPLRQHFPRPCLLRTRRRNDSPGILSNSIQANVNA
eukprot:scaffold977_cov253-Pinguiococcus_pyrenoidosus.AAC.14